MKSVTELPTPHVPKSQNSMCVNKFKKKTLTMTAVLKRQCEIVIPCHRAGRLLPITLQKMLSNYGRICFSNISL